MKKLMLIFCILFVFLVGVQSLYDSSSKVITLSKYDFQTKVVRSSSPWFVEFYAPWCGHCKNLAPEWSKLASALEGIINVGAVDMTTDQEAGAAYNIQGFPTIKFFGSDKNRPIDYNGGRSANEMLSFAFDQTKNMALTRMKGGSRSSSSGSGGGSRGGSEGDVIVLEDGNFDSLVMNSNDAWFIEFYAPWCGHCKRLEPEWNNLAGKLKGEVKVAKVDATVNQQLGSRFQIQGYPTLKFFPPGKKSESKVIPYDLSRDSSSMYEWAMEQVNQNKAPMFDQLDSEQTFDDFCKSIKGICLVAFLPHIYDSNSKERNNYASIMKELSEKYKGRPITFLWAQGGDFFDLEESLSLGSGFPSVIAFSFNKNVYSIMRGTYSKVSIDAFISAVLAGRESFLPLNKNLPKLKKVDKWDGKDKKPPTSDDSYIDDL